MRPLILGAAARYRPDQVSVFVSSLKKSRFEGATTLIIDRPNARLRDYLVQNGIEVISVDLAPDGMLEWMAKAARRLNRAHINLPSRMLKTGRAFVAKRLPSLYAVNLVSLLHDIARSRYIHYLRYLDRNPGRFTHILLTDVRDVAFQADPFEGAPARCLWLFRENARQRLGREPFNRSWIETLYGARELEQIGANYITCSGTTLGSTDLIVSYLEQMTVEVIRLTPKYFGLGLGGGDQAIHNRLYRTGHFPEAELKNNYEGPVATLHYETPDEFRFDDAGRLLNFDGSPVALLHQYDRHPILVEKVSAQVVAL